MTRQYRFAVMLAGATAIVSLSSASGVASSRPAAHPGEFVAAVSGGGPSARGLAVFSAADGRLLRWLARSAKSPVPVAVSPDGRWVYFYNQAPAASCPHNGFTEPVLWRVPARGGHPRRAGIDTTSIAFSPDGRMVARTATRPCGQTVWIIITDRRTGASRRILLWRNVATSNNPVFSAALSWAPDDRHLAVGISPAAAINGLTVINALRATNAGSARSIPPCAAGNDECAAPGFDIRGRLTFLKWRNEITPPPERIMRLRRRHLIRLLRLSRDESAGYAAGIAVDRAGNAILLEGGVRRPEIWIWSAGRVRLLLRSTRQMTVTSPLWLSAG